MTNAFIQEIKDDVSAILAKIEGNTTVQTVITDVKSDAVTLEQWVVTNGYPLILQDASAVITGILTGTPWATIVATLITTAAAQTKTIEAGVAHVALNLAQSQLIVSGAVAPVTPTPAVQAV